MGAADEVHFVNPKLCSEAEPGDTLVWCECGDLRASQRLHGETLEDERLRKLRAELAERLSPPKPPEYGFPWQRLLKAR
ncbi:MAG TPA: hypothetical protein VN894_12695 [Polyangiaceae bacterium]|nr:hypothetical protein [Polyangiaceae bacterium]